MPGTEHPFRRGGKGEGENVAPQRHRMAGFAAAVEGGRRCNMRHRVYSKDAAERTVPQRQENMGKAAVVGRWAERELVKDEKRREKKERKKEGREREKSEEKKRKKKEKESEETERKQEKGNSTDNWKDNRSVRNSITPWRRWLPKREGTHKVGRISKG